MIREQATLKVAGSEIPLIAFDDWRFWVLILIGSFLIGLWVCKRK